MKGGGWWAMSVIAVASGAAQTPSMFAPVSPPALAIRDASTALGLVLEAVEHAHHTSKG